MSRIQCEKKKNFDLEIQSDNHGQIFPSTLYMRSHLQKCKRAIVIFVEKKKRERETDRERKWIEKVRMAADSEGRCVRRVETRKPGR